MTDKIESLVRWTSYLLSLSEEDRRVELEERARIFQELAEAHEKMVKAYRIEMEALIKKLGPAKDSRSIEERENAKDDADADYHPARNRWPGEA